MSVCGDFGGVTARGDPCQRPMVEGLCPSHREGKSGAGRPSIYTDELAGMVCMRLIAGESLRTICSDEDMPGKSTVLQWVVENRGGFADQYARARQAQALILADELMAIADDGRNDTYVDDEGQVRVDYDHIQRSRLRVDTRKWVLSRMLPKVYGNKTALEHSGPRGGPIQVETNDVRERFTRRIAGIASRVGANGGDRGAAGNGASGS